MSLPSLSLPSLLPDDTRRAGVRGLIACVASCIAYGGFWMVQAYAQGDPVGGAHYNLPALAVMQHLLEASMLATVVLGLFCWHALRAGSEPRWLSTLLTVTLTIAYTLIGLAYGFYTSPMGFVIMGVLAFGLMFFDTRAVVAGMIVCVAMFLGNEVLMYADLIAYAPLLADSPFVGDSMQLDPWWAIHLRVILGVAFCAFFALLYFQIEQLEAQRHALHVLAVSDPLTGVANRRRFDERLQEELLRRDRSGRPFCLLLCDADHFKKVNDTHGHPAGDRVLQHFASVLTAGVRANIDVVGRLGGEEFGVIITETSLADACEVAERVGAQMRNHVFTAAGQRFSVTVSIGVAECTRCDGEEGLKIADANLYRAKGEGRDRVIGSRDRD